VVRPNRWGTRAIMRQNCESQAHDFYPTQTIGYDALAVLRSHDGLRLPTICAAFGHDVAVTGTQDAIY